MAHSILIVDDEALTLRTIGRALDAEGYEVFLAATGEEALKTIADQQPDFALLDVVLPGINGIEVLRQARTASPATIFVMMSAYHMVDRAVEAMKLGAYDFLVKPFHLSDMVATLKRAAEMLGLERLLDRKPAQLSGGQQQRVALGRAVVAETAVCLMDEPLSNLDAQLRGDMRREIRALQRRLGITMLYVTHDQVEAMTMADRVILMRAGHVEQNGTPASLYEQPETTFAAGFIGAPAMNLLPAAALAKYPELLTGMPAGYDPRSLIVGVRPESVALAREGLQARIIAAEYLGADTQVETRIDEETLMVRLPGRAPPGANIYVKWRAQDAHWFDASSHRRIGAK